VLPQYPELENHHLKETLRKRYGVEVRELLVGWAKPPRGNKKIQKKKDLVKKEEL